MKRRAASIISMSCLLGASLYAQTPSIGGGTCNSGSLNGIYSVSSTGRQIAAASAGPATFTGVFQANGAATFDGLSKVAITLTADTNQASGSTLTWSGTYSVQANCAAVINISTGGSATLNLAIYDGGVDFLVSGSDATYTYAGSGIAQPSGCTLAALSGVYSLTGTGFALNGTAVSGVENGTGLLQFDGQGHLIVNISTAATGGTPSALTLTGTYTVSSGCLGSAALTDSGSNAYAMSFSIYNTKVTSTAFYAMLAEGSKFLISGSGHALYGEPVSSAAQPRIYAMDWSGDAAGEERA